PPTAHTTPRKETKKKRGEAPASPHSMAMTPNGDADAYAPPAPGAAAHQPSPTPRPATRRQTPRSTPAHPCGPAHPARDRQPDRTHPRPARAQHWSQRTNGSRLAPDQPPPHTARKPHTPQSRWAG